jgi:predicted AAA+ superfamily ATPase
MEEKVSLSDRFGIWVAFYAFSQDRYIDAVRLSIDREARQRKVTIPWTIELEREAIQWSHDKSKRCGRTAFQFAKNWIGRHLLAKNGA